VNRSGSLAPEDDIYEGTQQINLLIVARRILDYPSSMLR
jgi:alkylation response protein AidB-like acyl-CoA dehydrogenase